MSKLRLAYSTIIALGSFVAALGFALHSRGRPRLAERFGGWALREREPLLWFHAASMGEVMGMRPVLQAARRAFPELKLLLTATSTSGLAAAEDLVDHSHLLPFDSELWYRRALHECTLAGLVISETEIWPGLLGMMHQHGVPTLLINGRLSDFSIRNYRWLKPFLRGMNVMAFSKVLVPREIHRERFMALGIESNCIELVGNTKYEKPRSIATDAEALQLKRQCFSNDVLTFILASLRPGEEEVWFPAIQGVRDLGMKLNVVVAPRHLERLEHFKRKMKEANISFSAWSEFRDSSQVTSDCDSLLIDTYGDLERMFSFADATFVGATIIDYGGHNPIEAAAYGNVLVVGPHVSNISDVIDVLKEKKAVVQVENEEQAFEFLQSFLSDPARYSGHSTAARELWRSSQGSTARVVQVLRQVLGGKARAAA